MFKVRRLAYRPWPVTISLLQCNEANGTVSAVENTAVFHFSPFTEEEFQANRKEVLEKFELSDNDGSTDNLPMEEVLRFNAELFGRIIVGWGQEVQDENGAPVPFSKEILAGMITGLDGSPISAGINKAITEIRFGVAPVKNSKTSPEPGPIQGEVAATSSPTT